MLAFEVCGGVWLVCDMRLPPVDASEPLRSERPVRCAWAGSEVMTSETGLASAANHVITTTGVHLLDFILPPFDLRLVGRKALPVQRLGAMPSLTERYRSVENTSELQSRQ